MIGSGLDRKETVLKCEFLEFKLDIRVGSDDSRVDALQCFMAYLHQRCSVSRS